MHTTHVWVIFTLSLIGCLITASGCDRVRPTSPTAAALVVDDKTGFQMGVSEQALADQLAAMNFSEALAEAQPRLGTDEITAPWSVSYDGINPADYSPAELKLMGGWTSKEGRFVSLMGPITESLAFHEQNARLPSDAQELLIWAFRNRPAQLAQLLNAPKGDFIERLGDYVNPVTGKLYTSFTDSSWSPGGVRLVQLRTQEEFAEAWGDRAGEPQVGDPQIASVWKVVLFGEHPDELLGSHPLIQEASSGTHQMAYPPGVGKKNGVPPMLTIPDDHDHAGDSSETDHSVEAGH